MLVKFICRMFAIPYDMILPTRFNPNNQDADVAAFTGFPRQIRYRDVMISNGTEYLLKKYNAFWLLNSYISLCDNENKGYKLLPPKLLTHEIICAPYVEAYRYVITDGITILHSRKYNEDGRMGNGFMLYSVSDPYRSLGSFMLPSEFPAYNSVFRDISPP